MGDKPISYMPTEGLCYDPSQPVYWEPDALQQEITRAFEICHGCRMCFKYCDSFPTLFDLIDEKHDGDVTKITAPETKRVFDACFQCKLCEVQCPYTPRDGHEFQLDFPKIVHRFDAIRARKHGVAIRDRILGAPDFAAFQARLSFGLANLMNRFPPFRFLLEKALGIHRHKLLPEFASSTFESWAVQEGLTAQGPGGEAVLFQTCYVQNNEPQIGRDTVEVFQRNQVDLRCSKGLSCCGMPAWEHGDLAGVRAAAKHNLDRLMPYVDAGAKVVAINPTCSMMLRREYPELVDPLDKARAERLAEAVRDPGEFLWAIRNEPRFQTEVKSRPESVAYHAPCHLRTQGVGFKGRDLMRKILKVSPETVMECCGHDGTYAMTVDGFEPSQRIGKKAFEGMKDSNCTTCATDCPLAALQFEQHGGIEKPLHPMSILARAYRGDPFPTEPKETQA